MKQMKQKLAEKLEEELEVDVAPNDIEIPEPEHGDFAYPAMKAASQLGREPRKLAEKLVEPLEEMDAVKEVEVAGPGYLNFFLDRESYAEKVRDVLEAEKMGVEERNGKMRLEFSQPNLAKPMHIGHLRNNVLGDSIQRIMNFVGYNVVSENYIGDWGTQYGKVIYAFKEYGSMEEFKENPMEHMYDLYVRFHDKADEEMEEKGREWARKIEEGDEEAVELWKMFREASIEYDKKEYQRLGIEFTRWTGEARVVELAKELVEKWIDEGELEEDEDGSVFIEFEDRDFPGTVIRKADGSTLYITRDLANLKKLQEEDFDYNLYVVASEQDLHFKQVFRAKEKLGIDAPGEHVSYGMLSLKEGAMSSREGNIIRQSELMDKATEEAEKRMGEKDGDPEAVGLGALKYANLSVSRKKDIEFDWERALSFEGDSGPYLQYSNVRAKSILKESEEEAEITGEFNEQEYRLVKKLAEFPEKIENAVDQREPAKIANYLSYLCEEFNSFYHSCQVVGEDQETEKRRLKIVELFIEVTDQGLELLGIEPLEEM